jgi:hypothetical protein
MQQDARAPAVPLAVALIDSDTPATAHLHASPPCKANQQQQCAHRRRSSSRRSDTPGAEFPAPSMMRPSAAPAASAYPSRCELTGMLQECHSMVGFKLLTWVHF